jgi:glycosyltransferase A (GT-A) superfamily protein (DUF2064 family)
VPRHLVLFAREPAREAREKGLSPAGGAELFASFARSWIDAARSAGARISIAAPAEDMLAWRRRLRGDAVGWISQHGRSFGGRLRQAAAAASIEKSPVVFVGGDVPGDPAALSAAFEALERGASSVLAPSSDGGVSLLALEPADHDLLGGIRSGSSTVFAALVSALRARGRRTVVLELLPDVDRRADVRRLVRSRFSVPSSLIRSALASPRPSRGAPARTPRSLRLAGPSGLRAPPAAA